MEHFNIVLGLCRSAAQVANPAVRAHIERLRKALEREGSKNEAASLKKVSDSVSLLPSMAPSRVVLSRQLTFGEELTESVQCPVDKETAAKLAEVKIVKDTPAPIFNKELQGSLSSILEEWKNVEVLRSAGVEPALSVMLYGDPGTGKTMLAEYIAKELGLPVVVAKLDGIISSFLGTTARNIANLFDFANRYKCILLLDEFDAIAKLRDDPHELGEIKRVVNTLLQCIDSRSKSGFTIAITNHQGLLDPAIWRRFEIRVEVPRPNIKARSVIIKKYFDYIEDEVQLKFLAWLTAGESGAEIVQLSQFIKRHKALKKDEYDFLSAIKNHTMLSAKVDEAENRKVSQMEPEFLARELFEQNQESFNQEQLAALFGRSQSTISRWIKKKEVRV
ncbi:AAA family ATPase [Pseudomonas sp. A-R-19]|uniref:AAA family ATPase n=1 Tax=Pseudomonas sp. A-R-19 TaxID=2832403 RepID=UPI001CC01852|nr:ATP-binding protein [Pseudomonas sp. A-R-19]